MFFCRDGLWNYSLPGELFVHTSSAIHSPMLTRSKTSCVKYIIRNPIHPLILSFLFTYKIVPVCLKFKHKTRHFVITRNKQTDTVSIDRLKPVYIELESSQSQPFQSQSSTPTSPPPTTTCTRSVSGSLITLVTLSPLSITHSIHYKGIM